MERPADANNKPTSIPRLSKLPVLSKRSSQLFTAPPPDVVEQAPASSSSSSSSLTSSRLAKRSSIASLPRLKEPLTKPVGSTARPAFNGRATISNGAPPPRLTTRTVSSKSTVPRRLSRATSSVGWSPVEDETTDRLSSLDSFRSASRQGIYDDNESPTEPETRNLPVTKPRASRPSLSDRAIESIQAVPATPKDRRQSNFFNNAESPMGPPPRPSSVLSGQYNGNGRPGTSDGSFSKPAAISTASKTSMSAKPSSRTSNGNFGSSQIGITKRGTTTTTTLSARLQSAREPRSRTSRPSSPTKHSRDVPEIGTVDKPLSGTGSKRIPSNPSDSTSAALRQQIAAAKAAARRGREPILSDTTAVFDDQASAGLEEHDDPFNQAPRDDKHILRNRIRTARMDGKLNISALGLKSIPDEVLSMYTPASVQESNVNWAEMVDLTKFVAADNELDVIEDKVFPDLSYEQLLEEEENEQSAQFGGLEMLDLHGNALTSIPLGLRRLERLTSLNLVHNKIENAALDIIAQVRTLRELRLGHNSISGNLPVVFCALPSLEVLDLQSNRLLALPEAVRELTGLRVLNVSGNQLTALPMDAISQLPLQELDASSNALIASLFPLGGSSQHRTLRTLNVANNSLAALTFSPELDLPELRALDVTNNHLTVLPPMQGWQKLMTLTAGDNKISELPDGFVSLRNLRIANLSGNELHILPSEMALMESLTTLVLASNPLRHKKYLNMGAADIKQDLRALLGNRSEFSPDEYDDELVSWGTAPEESTFVTGWAIKPGGLLDLSGKGLTDAINDSLGSFLRTTEVRQLKLSNNKLTTIPPALWLGNELRSLDLSNNPLETDYLSDELTLPMLSELDMSNCRITIIDPLLQHLRAPELQSLQLTGNRSSGSVPMLRSTYPRLTTLLASDNKFSSVSVEALRGFTIVDLASNDLQSLPAEIGLLWDEGLKSFEVGRNAFRVPGHRVLEKGTQATMRWLKDRIKSHTEDDATTQIS